MTSHGVPRGQAIDRSEKAQQKTREDIARYKSLVDQVNNAADKGDYSRQTLDHTTKLLTRNPEDYSAWNHRRRCFQTLFKDPAEKIEDLLSADLAFLFPLLMKYPKCYWIWNHRIWLLKETSERCSAEISRQTWEREVGLVGKMLSRDSRNFHGWSYRRFVIAELEKLVGGVEKQAQNTSTITIKEQSGERVSSPSLTEQEFEYTTRMLRTNLSNFSAWHNRSKLIPRLLDERGATETERRKLFDNELNKVGDALSIDPYDQSLWFYHQYLITELVSEARSCFGSFTVAEREAYLRKEVHTLEEMVDDFDDCKWILQNLIELGIMLRGIAGTDGSVTQADLQSWLKKLRQLDPLRKGRWDDVERALIDR